MTWLSLQQQQPTPTVLKFASLGVLALQHFSLSFILERSYFVPTLWHPSVTLLVLLCELLKFQISLILHICFPPSPSHSTSFKSLLTELFGGDSWKLVFPAALYTLQTYLLYYAISILELSWYLITYQVKTVVTALCARMLLKQRFNAIQWLSLLVITTGVVLSQTCSFHPSRVMVNSANLGFKLNHARYNNSSPINDAPFAHSSDIQTLQISGFLAVLAASVLSALAGLYMERVFKAPAQPATATITHRIPLKPKSTLWLRNLQLSCYSIPISVIIGCFSLSSAGPAAVVVDSPIWIFLAVLLQAIGGLLVSCTLQYADNVLKCVSISLSIVFISLTSPSWLLQLHQQYQQQQKQGWRESTLILGIAAVLLGTWHYVRIDSRSRKKYGGSVVSGVSKGGGGSGINNSVMDVKQFRNQVSKNLDFSMDDDVSLGASSWVVEFPLVQTSDFMLTSGTWRNGLLTHSKQG